MIIIIIYFIKILLNFILVNNLRENCIKLLNIIKDNRIYLKNELNKTSYELNINKIINNLRINNNNIYKIDCIYSKNYFKIIKLCKKCISNNYLFLFNVEKYLKINKNNQFLLLD